MRFHIQFICLLGFILPLQTHGEVEVQDKALLFLTAQLERDYKTAIELLSYDKSDPQDQRKQKSDKAVEQMKQLETLLGELQTTEQTGMPQARYSTYEIGLLPESKLSSSFLTLHFPVNFSKAGYGVVTFILGEASGELGIEQVQYWCFTC